MFVVDEVKLFCGPRLADFGFDLWWRQVVQVVAAIAAKERIVVVVMPDVPNHDFRRKKPVDTVHMPVAVDGPPEVELHPGIAAERRTTPAPIRPAASLDDRCPPVGRQALYDGACGLPEVVPLLQFLEDILVDPQVQGIEHEPIDGRFRIRDHWRRK
ncbi:MAG: hypothetical protein F4089_06070 [Gammaproteobacteria bacterium]|nr:hypothetical protein [Gammaproteobacteria bacterium]